MKDKAVHFICILVAGLGIAAAAGIANEATAQASKSPLFKGTAESKGQPVKIQAASLEVRDKDKVATFRGDVHLIQGDTDVRCAVLVVYYEGQIGGAPAEEAKAATPKSSAKSPAKSSEKSSGGGGNSQIRRMEAQGGVVVIQKDQRATGDRGDFDMRANTVTLIGNVVVTRGDDVLRGQRLVVDLTTGVYNMESGGGRVEGLFKSSQGKKQDPNNPDEPPPRRPRRSKQQ